MSERQLTLEERLTLEGVPFQLKLSTADNTTTEVTFTLDTDDYDDDGDNDDETTPFLNKILIITSIKIICDTASVLDYLALDNKTIIDGGLEGYTANDDFHATGESKGTSADEHNYPTVKDIWGAFLSCRAEIALKASATDTNDGIDLYLKGFVLDRKY